MKTLIIVGGTVAAVGLFLLATASGNEVLTATGRWPCLATAAGPRPTELLLPG